MIGDAIAEKLLLGLVVFC